MNSVFHYVNRICLLIPRPIMKAFLFVILLQFVSARYEDTSTCDKRTFERDSFVCVCDDEYCDVVGDVSMPPPGSFKSVVSSRDKYRFKIFEGKESPDPLGDLSMRVNYEKEFQTILGFGGAFTDSSGIVISSLHPNTRTKLIRSYFSEDGIEYNLGRVPIAGTDFSTYPYSYDEVDDDVDLNHFALTKEDYLYKIPYIKQAIAAATDEVLLFSSIWSPPPWMKENKKHNGKGGVLKNMWDPYANYLIRFVKEYGNQYVFFWGITTVNEPMAGSHDWTWNACHWPAEDMRDWIKSSFRPALEEAHLEHLKVMIHDHARDTIPSYPEKILSDETANHYVDGVAVHWYEDFQVSPEVLDELHEKFEDKFILYTEACEGFASAPQDKVQLGSWGRAENYSISIIQSLNHHSIGWVDWNLALNTEGGPNWAGNIVDAPIIVNEEKKEFYKQPMFYAMGHFSKFIKRGSKRLHASIDGPGVGASELEVVAFRTSDEDTYTFVILNRSEEEQRVNINTKTGAFINLHLDPKSVETVLVKFKNVVKANPKTEL